MPWADDIASRFCHCEGGWTLYQSVDRPADLDRSHATMGRFRGRNPVIFYICT